MRRLLLTLCTALAVALPASGWAQSTTSTLTGRATDGSGAALPGATVSVSSDNLIGGARTSVTDDQGLYRITQLPGGTYTVVFELAGFSTLKVEQVSLLGGSTMTINGKLELATVQETVTVTSQAPTIDLESSKVAVTWDQQKMDDLPYSRSLSSLVSLVPGLYATAYDVGGSNFGTGSGPTARTFGRPGGNVVMYDGMVWDQTYGDYGSFEEAQITTASKGADAMNPGLSMNLVIKSGGNTFRGSAMGQYQNSDMQSKNITPDLLRRGYSPGVNKFTSLRDLYVDIGGPVLKDRLWFYLSYRDGRTGQLIPGFIRLSDRQQPEFFSKLENPTAKITFQVTKNNKIEAMAQGGRKWQPYRTASRFVPLESTQNQDSYSLIGPSFKWLTILGSKATFDASLQRGGYWWPDVPWTEDVRKQDLTTTATRGAYLKSDRRPKRWQFGTTVTYFAELFGRNHEIKTGYLGWRATNETDNLGYPNQQVYRYRSQAGDASCTDAANWDGCFARPDSVLVYDYPNTTSAGEWYHSGYVNDRITVNPKLTVNVGVRYDRYSSFLPEQGNPGTGPFATKNLISYTDAFPVYSTFVPRVSAVYDLTGQGRVAVRASYGRYVGGSSGVLGNPGPSADNVNPNAIITRTYSNWDGRIPYVPVPANLTSTSGGGTNRTIDPGMKGPFVDEYTAGLDIGLNRVMTMQLNYVRKYDGRGNMRDNLAMPYGAYTVTTTAVDPGRDNVTGTADDRTLTIYSVPRTYPTFGQNVERISLLSNADSRNKYDAIGATFNKQFSGRWSFLTSFDASYRDLMDATPRNPNEALYGPSDYTSSTAGNNGYRRRLPEWSYAMRMSGTYQLPWGILYAGSFTAQSGEWFQREVQVRDANGSNVLIYAEPQAGRYPWVRLFDNRISKRVKVVGTHTIEGMLDVFNTLNANTVTEQTNRNGSAYLQPTTIISPRVMRVSLRYKF